MSPASVKDLVVLAADKNMESAVRGILERNSALGLREIATDIYVHPERDPGCLNRGVDFLGPFAVSHTHALLLFDHQGCGREADAVEQLEAKIEDRLVKQGWQGCAAIVIAPELENWVWSDSPHVEHVLGWSGRNPTLRQWLDEKKYWPPGQSKPDTPKEAVEAAIRLVKKQRSSSLYSDLAAKVSFERCTDRAFVKLKTTLQFWFGATDLKKSLKEP